MESANVDRHTPDVIAAFVDRERVDPSALKTALATEAGREYLVDLLALREVMAEPAATPPADRTDSPWRRWPTRLSAVAAAVVVAAAGYQVGVLSAVPRLTTSPVVFERTSDAAPVPPITTAAPAPTSVIYLEPGVDWYQGGVN